MSIERIPVHLVLYQIEHDWYMLSKWVTRAIQGFNSGISTLIGTDRPVRGLMIVLVNGNESSLHPHQFLCTDTKTNEIWGEDENQEKIGESPRCMPSPIAADTVDNFIAACSALMDQISEHDDGRIHSLISPKTTIIKSLKTAMAEIKKYQQH